MGKTARKRERNFSSRNVRRRDENNVYDFPQQDKFGQETRVVAKTLKAKNSEQQRYIEIIRNQTVTIAIGQPGTGKTFIPSVMAGQELTNPKSIIEKVILIRPNEPLGKSLGMLPGDLSEKLEPWLEPIADGIKYAIGDMAYKGYVERKKIQFLAIEHARGRTFNNAYVIIDEAQNISIEAMIALMTRVGQDCKIIVCGDIAQKDIKGDSGLGMLIDLYDKYDYVPFQMIELLENVRSRESAAFYAMFKEEGLVQ